MDKMEMMRKGLERVLALSEAASRGGISHHATELNRAVVFATNLEILPKVVSAEQLTVSRSAELVCSGPSDYSVHVSTEFLSSTNNPREVLFDLIKKGEMYIALSDLARSKGQYDLTINAGQRVALCDPVTDVGHPIYFLLSGG